MKLIRVRSSRFAQPAAYQVSPSGDTLARADYDSRSDTCTLSLVSLQARVVCRLNQSIKGAPRHLAWSIHSESLVVCTDAAAYVVPVWRKWRDERRVQRISAQWREACFLPEDDHIAGVPSETSREREKVDVFRLGATTPSRVATHYIPPANSNVALLPHRQGVLVVGSGRIVHSDGSLRSVPSVGTRGVYDLAAGPTAAGNYLLVEQPVKASGPNLVFRPIITQIRVLSAKAPGSSHAVSGWDSRRRIRRVTMTPDGLTFIESSQSDDNGRELRIEMFELRP